MAPTVPVEYIRRGDLTACLQRSNLGKMGKARKSSKGYSINMNESDGFGCVGTEIAVSEGSNGIKRKSLDLNLEPYNRFGVHYQVFSLSKLSPLEKTSLEKRFKSELERVKILQKRIASMETSGSFVSPSSNIHSSSQENRKRGFPGKNGSRAKPPLNSSIVKLMKQCENLVNQLMAHPYGWVFSTPVDVVKLNIPDYFDVIEHPMDLGTVKNRLSTGEYSSPLGFAADVRLTFSNAKTYNPIGNDVHTMADMLSKLFESKWKPIEKKVPIVVDTHAPPTSSVYIGPKTYPPPPSKKRKTAPPERKAIQEPLQIAMPVVDKQKLSLELEDLMAELPNNIIDFLKIHSCNDTQTDDDEIEIDIYALSYDTVLTLRNLLDDYMLDRQKHKEQAEHCEMELQNEAGINNLSVQPPQGVELAEEDVDIGGDDPPMSTYPPVQIEREETTRRTDKRTSSSSSSGSSSSDSDSGSSSDNESDGEKATGAAVSPKDVLASEVYTEHKTKDVGDLDNKDHFLRGLNQAEQNSESKEENPVLAESQLEGESAPHGRQASPGKLYRAAMLRKRFADTIIKAQEKTLAKTEKQDPENLRLKKEELERRKIEEKSRLLAEAKAAEEACKKAEADAASEAKRKRALEREAARLALQKLEKNVSIQENCQLLDDLEMLRSGDAENVENLIDEASPYLYEDKLGSFKFQGNSNPLEQLGLYMKMDDDDDEDEEAELQIAVSPDDAEKENNVQQGNNVDIENDAEKENDVEEGELD